MCDFTWDPAKAAKNLRKHGISFDLATTVFVDPLMLSIRDDYTEFEERCVTVGEAQDRRLLVVSYTRDETADGSTSVRVISARPATPKERQRYESGE